MDRNTLRQTVEGLHFVVQEGASAVLRCRGTIGRNHAGARGGATSDAGLQHYIEMCHLKMTGRTGRRLL